MNLLDFKLKIDSLMKHCPANSDVTVFVPDLRLIQPGENIVIDVFERSDHDSEGNIRGHHSRKGQRIVIQI